MNERQLKLDKEILICQVKHNQSIKLFKEMLDSQYKSALETIKRFNFLPEIYSQQSVKTVLALDATGSM